MARKPWVLITGATSGIGLSTAVLLSLHGYEVIATGRSKEKMAILDRAAKEANTTIRKVPLEVTDEASIANCKNEVLALTNGYGVDALINNAGYGDAGAMEDIPIARLRQVFDTNVIGLVAVTQAFLPEMKARGQGKIVNVSSVVGKFSIPLLGAYTATKHAVEAISDAMRMELKGAGIQVVIVAPGSISTNFSTTVAGFSTGYENPRLQKAYAKFERDRSNERGAKPIIIAKTIHAALESKHPKARYATPFESKAAPVLKGLLPTRAIDSALRKFVLGE